MDFQINQLIYQVSWKPLMNYDCNLFVSLFFHSSAKFWNSFKINFILINIKDLFKFNL